MYISDHRSFSFELAARQAHTLVGMGDIVGLRRDSHDPLACHKAQFRIASQSYSLLAFYKLSETHNTSICPYVGVCAYTFSDAYHQTCALCHNSMLHNHFSSLMFSSNFPAAGPGTVYVCLCVCVCPWYTWADLCIWIRRESEAS